MMLTIFQAGESSLLVGGYRAFTRVRGSSLEAWYEVLSVERS